EGGLEVGKGVQVIDLRPVAVRRIVGHLGFLAIAFFVLPYAESAGGLQQCRDILDIYHAGSSLVPEPDCASASGWVSSPLVLSLMTLVLCISSWAATACSISCFLSLEVTRHSLPHSADFAIVVICSANRTESCKVCGRNIQQSSSVRMIC